MPSKTTPKTGLPTFRDILYFLHLDKAKSILGHKPSPVVTNLSLVSFQAAFNLELKQFIKTKLESCRKVAHAELITETIGYATSIVLNGGKRIRPYVSFLAYCTEGGMDQKEALKLSVGLELFHAFALIHDDIIDKGTERHGKATTHVQVAHMIEGYPRGDKPHLAEGMALLAGDLIFGWAYEVILGARNPQVQQIFSTMVQEVVAGQMLDVSLMMQYEVPSETIRRKNELKTALYSFVHPMHIGSAYAYSSRHDALYRQFGLLIGQAFQIQDDLLDIVGDSSKMGKVTFIDIQDGQHTLLTQHIFEHGKPHDREILMSLFGKPIDEHGRKVLARIFEYSGAIRYAKKEIKRLLEEAQELIIASDLKQTYKDAWLEIVALLERRRS